MNKFNVYFREPQGKLGKYIVEAETVEAARAAVATQEKTAAFAVVPNSLQTQTKEIAA